MPSAERRSSMSMFHEGSRTLQDRFDTRRIADRIDERLVSETISDHDREFIEARDMFFLATADEEGRPNASYKGGDPGFVRVVDDRTLAFPATTGTGCSCRWATSCRTRRWGCCSSTSNAGIGCG
jgi:predicted pyridoxine 5'-phosphate oxidase superfamily flavin-nucleotide-binding protein